MDKAVYSAPGIRVQKSEDGLERSIRLEQDWLGEKYGPIRFVCESSSIERLLTFLAEKSGKPIKEIKGKDLLPAGTFEYSFQGKTWNDKGDVFKEVLTVTGEAFALLFELTTGEAKTVLTVRRKPKGNA